LRNVARSLLLAAVMLAPISGARAEQGSVAELLFGAAPFANVRAPVEIGYVYASKDAEGRQATAPVRMEVRSVSAEGGKLVHLEIFDGDARREVGPVEMSSQNPLVLVFLQRDVSAMEKSTGGSQHYFRNRIRGAFNRPGEVEQLELEVEGRRIEATRIAIRPFSEDPRIDRFPAYRDKLYEFVVAPDILGGIWSLGTRTIDPQSGALISEERFTYAGHKPID
jgi:hypothetical protein